MTVEDWEVGALYWRLVDEGASPEEAAEKVKQKFSARSAPRRRRPTFTSVRFSQYREPLSSPVRRCTGFCYQLIRVEASGSGDQAVALVRRPLPSRAGLHPGRGRDGEPRYPLVC